MLFRSLIYHAYQSIISLNVVTRMHADFSSVVYVAFGRLTPSVICGIMSRLSMLEIFSGSLAAVHDMQRTFEICRYEIITDR